MQVAGERQDGKILERIVRSLFVSRSRLSSGGTWERYVQVMGDADGAFRGLRARPGSDLRRALGDHWRLGRFAEGIDLGGSSSLNLLVGDADRRYVVRVH